MDFLIGGVSAMGATVFTNPIEVIKTRKQLQGELKAKGKHAVHYRNILHAGYTIARNDGILALQKGLVPYLWTQMIMNGGRLGFYEWANKRGLVKDKNGNVKFVNAVFVAAFGGTLGQILCNPFYLIKTHLQSKATKTIAVGYQHEYSGTLGAFRNIYHSQGIKGLFRGSTACIPRGSVGSASQLIAFQYSKNYLRQISYFQDKKFLTTFLGSMIGGTAISVMITPFDLILTRIYNQPVDQNGKGVLYKNYIDCVTKIYKSEGITAFYKGLGPLYLRLGPHSVLCLIFWDYLVALHNKLK